MDLYGSIWIYMDLYGIIWMYSLFLLNMVYQVRLVVCLTNYN